MRTITAALFIPLSFVGSLSARAAIPAPEVSAPSAPVETSREPSQRSDSRIEFREIFWGSRYGLHHTAVAFQHGRPLEGAALYQALERPDLVRQYETRAHLRAGLVVAGAAAVLLGIAATVLDRPHAVCMDLPPSTAFPLPSTECHTEWNRGATIFGLSSVLAGTITIGVGSEEIPDPLDAEQLRAAVDVYNRDGARPSDGGRDGEAGPAKRTVGMTVAPSLLVDGGGVQLRGVF